mmetsp:Transcript_19650/g.23290  ORF Transcript_19650/g.23290 Transcript_19650/m.23290 type:complete len:208 (-) Transcript_19650:121-744(-)
MLCSAWWAFEVLTIMGGILGVTELASLTICLNIHAFLFRVPLGMTEAASALLGNAIGANNVRLAKRFASLIAKIVVTVITLLGAVTILARAAIVNFFTSSDNETLVGLTTQLMIVLGSCFMFDGMQAAMHGPIRALGLQKRASLIAITSYWLLGLPVAALLAFKCNMGVFGLMAGFAAAIILEFTAYAAILGTKNWQDVANQTIARI